MSALQWMAHVLETEWVEGADGDSPGVPGRTFPVPKPTMDLRAREGDIRLRNQDHINIADGGDETHEAASLGYQNETVESFVEVTIRTTHRPPDAPDVSSVPYVENPGEVRFEGARDANNEAEAYGGLKGEVKRILELYRMGHREFDLIVGTTWRDEAGITGKNHYRGTWLVALDDRLGEVNPPDPL